MLVKTHTNVILNLDYFDEIAVTDYVDEIDDKVKFMIIAMKLDNNGKSTHTKTLFIDDDCDRCMKKLTDMWKWLDKDVNPMYDFAPGPCYI